MFTLSQARAFIGSSAYFARGRAYAQQGHVRRVGVRENRGVLVYTGVVRGHGRSYEVSFDYDNEKERFLRCSCTCLAFPYAPSGCKHVAALMIVACGGAQNAESAEELRRRREDEQRRRLEEIRRAEQNKSAQFVKELLSAAPERYGQPVSEDEKVGIIPLLTPKEDGVALEIRIGNERMYAVRNLFEFAERAKRRERTVYGRQLTFTHSAQHVREEDAPLYWHVLAMADAAPKGSGGQMILRGALLDQTMRLLIGRCAEMRRAGGGSVRAEVQEGVKKLDVSLAQDGGRTLLRVQGAQMVMGSAGAYFFLEAEEKILCAFGDAFARLSALWGIRTHYPEGLALDDAQLDALCARLLAPAADEMDVAQGAEILAAHTPMAMRPRFYVDADGESLTCRIEFDYGGETVLPGGEAPHIRRDYALEEAAARAARELFPREVRAGEYAFEGGQQERFEMISGRLSALERWGDVLIAEQLARLNRTTRRAMSFGLALQGDKLILKGDLGGFSQEDLQAAALAYRQRRKYVRLPDGAYLSGEALEQAAQAGQMLQGLDVTAEQVQRGVEMDKSRALYVEEALKGREEMKLTAPQELLDWTQRLRRAQSVSAEQPESLKAELRGYQRTGLSWLCALSEAGFGGILADDMGLGKTIQALALLLHEKEKGARLRALVVCPASLQLNWLKEAQRFAPSLDAKALLGGAKERHALIGEEHELLIASYDQVRRDVQAYQGVRLSHVLLDEAQNIKNAASQAAKAVKTLSAEHRFAMTGTPVENRLGELWSIFDFLMPGYLYGYKAFRERFEAPIVQDKDAEAMENLRLLVAPFILRRMKRDVLSDLPDKVETTLRSEMTAQQRRQYAAQAAKLTAQAEGGLADNVSRMQMLAGLTRLRQICCDPRLCLEGYAGGSGKLEQCVELIGDCRAGGHRMLLFSQFTSMLDILEERLTGEGVHALRLDGDTPKQERARLAQAFNDGEGDVFLISLKAGGTGLNLTGADVVIHYDPWWNTAAQNQATDRAYRIGQTKGVQVVRLIAADSIEERIEKLQQQKAELAGGVLEGGEDLFTVDTQMLRELLRG